VNTPRSEDPFFSQEPTRAAVERIAAQSDLTLVVGAGASIESGLPSWVELIDRLSGRIASELGLDEDQRVSFGEWTRQVDGLLGAAAVAKATLGANFERTVRHELFRDTGPSPEPGPTARAIASLRLDWGDSCEVVTLNYDDCIERALDTELADRGFTDVTASAVANARAQRSTEILVRHPHGAFRPRRGATGEIVLSEAEYHAMADADHWQDSYFRERLESSTCLFLGTSLTDANLLRYLYRAQPRDKHVVLLVRQSDSERHDNASDTLVEARRETARRRWDAMNVEVLEADYHLQTSQFVYEIIAKRRLGRHYRRYGRRLADWHRRVSRMQLAKSGFFSADQDFWQQELARWVDVVRRMCAAAGATPSRGEVFQVSLWVRDPRSRSLVLWFSSDRAWRDPRTLVPVPIDWSGNWVATKAFCNGAVTSSSTEEVPTTRWNHVVGVPVFLDESGGSRLPVGVVTVSSTLGFTRSALHRARAALRDDIAPWLGTQAALILT
jgi:hypothetical protein